MADLARSLTTGVDHRCSSELALHVLEVMLAIEEAARSHRYAEVASTCVRPHALTSEDAIALMRDG